MDFISRLPGMHDTGRNNGRSIRDGCRGNGIRNEESLPEVSAPVDYILQEGDFSCLIEFDLVQYRKKHNTKSVKKTLSIPEWLNEAAMEHDINFSQVLQEALMKKMGI